MPKPLIAITALARVEDPIHPPVVGARLSYIRALLSLGASPLIIPLGTDPLEIDRILSFCDGLLLTGGEDVDPSLYGEAPHEKLGAIDPRRDALDISAIQIARSQQKPILGICRGCQILNVAYGGSLYQDIDAQRPQHDEHNQSRQQEFAHSLHLVATSKLASFLGPEDIRANSFHHQAVKAVGTGLVASGQSDDGLIEAIEDPSAKFIIGVQCHPEMLWDKTETRWKKLFTSFITSCGG
jgi:putative glutamine amidotransferase